MRVIKIFIAILAVMLIGCRSIDIPKEPLKPDIEDTEDGDTEKPEDGDTEEPGNGENPEEGETPGDNEEPQETYYVKVAQTMSDWSGDYIITYTSGNQVLALNSYSDSKGYGVDISNKVTSQGIHSNDGDQYKAIVEKSGNGYTIHVSGIGYIGLENSKNSINMTNTTPSSDDYRWTISYKDGGSVWISNLGRSNYRLQWNASANIFRCYTGSQKELTIYRRGISTGGNTGSGDGGNTEGGSGNDNDGGNTGGDEGGTTPDPDQGGEDDNGEIPTPVPGQSGKYGWYELPVIKYYQSGSYLIDNNDKNLYYAHHLCAGGEKGPGGRKARNYTVCFSAEHHVPMWVAAPRHKMYQSGASRTDAYAKDPSIPSDIQYNSKSTGGNCNKGHMLGSAERLSSTATNKQVFYYSNIAPQYTETFNTGGGGWNTLEDWVDGQVCSDTLYVVIGAYFEQYTDRRGYKDSPATISYGGRNDVSRPTMFYYILMRTKKGSSGKALKDCTASEIKCAAFVRSHKTPKGVAVGEKDMMSVSALEKITGFTYFPNVPQAPKDTYSASDWGL